MPHREMNKANAYFKATLEKIHSHGTLVPARQKYLDGTKASCITIGAMSETYDISKGEYPVHTYRNTPIKMAINEMLWIYKDQTSDLSALNDRGVYWWDEFDIGIAFRSIGKAYGRTVCDFRLISRLIDRMATHPDSRDHIMSLWQQEHIDYQRLNGGLVPCAYQTHWFIDNDFNVDFKLFQRSSDYITASAINKIQYVALGKLICSTLTNLTGKKHTLRYFTHLVDDVHIYDRHIPALKELLSREPIQEQPVLELIHDDKKSFYDYDIEDFYWEIPKGIEKLTNKLELAII